MKLLSVVGARPNFMKLASLARALPKAGIKHVIVHTGQHYDAALSDVFFRQLHIPQPAHNLGVGSGSHAEQTARVMLAIEPVLRLEQPDWVVTVGDVNSTLAAALTAAKLHIKVAHVEAGLRSYDERMPEEANRVITDRLSELLFTTSAEAKTNLEREGIHSGIHFVGNTMIDTLLASKPLALKTNAHKKLGFTEGEYGLVTMHRAENVDDAVPLKKLVAILNAAAEHAPLAFSIHPRTQAVLEKTGMSKKLSRRVRLLPPQGYLEFLELEARAEFVLTDSGGVQEETTVFGVPCLTARRNTERPVTVTMGTNTIVDLDVAKLTRALRQIEAGKYKKGKIPPLWDGKAGERIAVVFKKLEN